MSEKLSISYHTAKRILLELLEDNDFSTDEDILKILGSVVQKETCEPDGDEYSLSRIIIDKEGRVFLPDYSSMEIKIPYLPLEKNTEANKIKRSLDNLVEPVNNRIYETCSIIRRNFSVVIPEPLMEMYCITGKRGEKHQIKIDRSLIRIENAKLKGMFDTLNSI